MQVKENQRYKTISKERILAYLQNKLSGEEKQQFESALAEDVFLQDALEGFKILPAKDVHAFIDAIFKDVDLIAEKHTRKSRILSLQTRPLAIAALFLIFIGVSWFAVWFMNKSAAEQQIAKTETIYDSETKQDQASILMQDSVTSANTGVQSKKNEQPAADHTISGTYSNSEEQKQSAVTQDQLTAEKAASQKEIVQGETEAKKTATDDYYSLDEKRSDRDAETDNEVPASQNAADITIAGTVFNEPAESVSTEDDKGDKRKLFKKENKDMASGTSAAEQNENTVIEDNDSVYVIVDQMPAFIGGEPALQKYLKENLRYPQGASGAGNVYTSFIISESGAINDVKIIQGLGSAFDEETIRVVKAMPNWIPGKQNGQPVKVSYTMVVKFSL